MKIYKPNFYAFDSFKGLPEIKNIDKNHPIFSKGRYDSTRENFENTLKNNNVDLSKVNIIKAFMKIL